MRINGGRIGERRGEKMNDERKTGTSGHSFQPIFAFSPNQIVFVPACKDLAVDFCQADVK